MPDRVTTARLKADASQFIRELEKAAAAARAFDKSLGGGSASMGTTSSDLNKTARSADQAAGSMGELDGSAAGAAASMADLGKSTATANASATRSRTIFSSASGSIKEAGAAARSASADMDKLGRSTKGAMGGSGGSKGSSSILGELGETSDRIAIITQAVLAFGPALVPAFGLAAQGIVGLTTQLTFAAAAGGTALLAFSGVGDALGALNAAQLDPSVANMEKLQQTMKELGPAGGEFVLFLDNASGYLEKVQRLAGASLFPGLMEGMQSMSDMGPVVERIIENTGLALGDLAVAGGDALHNSAWTEFFDYLATDAEEILGNLGRSIGNFVQGIGSIMVAFEPLTDDFSKGMLGMSRDFAGWAEGLNETQGFSDFIDYVREMGPQVGAALQAIASAFLDIGKAAAPMSGMVLTAIQGLFETISAIASSPAGPVIAGLATAFGALHTVARVGKWTGLASLGTMLSSVPASAGAATKALDKTRASIGKFLLAPGAGLSKAGGIGGLAAGAGMLGDSFEKIDTALSLGGMALLMGGSPLVAGVATLAGGMIDAAQANNDFEASYDRLQSTLSTDPLNFAQQNAELQTMIDDATKFKEENGEDDIFSPGAYKNTIEGWFGQSDVEEQAADIEAASQQVIDSQQNVIDVANRIKGDGADIFQGMTNGITEATKVFENAGPALDELGVSVTDLISLDKKADAGDTFAAHQLEEYARFIEEFNSKADTVSGRSAQVSQALTDIGAAATTAATEAAAFGDAMSALTGPMMGLIGAQDAVGEGLDHMAENLAKGSKSLVGQNDAARQNRAVVMGLVTNYQDLATAQVNAGRGSATVARTIGMARENIIRVGEAAGMSGPQIKNLLNTLNLTPEFVRTQMEIAGVTEAENSVRNLVDSYNHLPKDVRIYIKAHGLPETNAELAALKAKFPELTNKQLKIIANMTGNADAKIDGVRAKVKDLDGTTATVKVDMKMEGDKQAGTSATGAWDVWDMPGKEKVSTKTVKVKVDADTGGAKKEIAALGGKTKPVKIDVKVDSAGAEKEISGVKRAADKIGQGKTTIKIDANTQGATGDIKQVTSALRKLDGMKTSPKIDAQPQQALQACQQVTQAMNKVDGLKATPTVTANVGQALSAINSVISALSRVQSKSVTVTTNHVSTGGGRARGGPVYGPGGPREDLIPAMLSNGEFVVNAAATAANFQKLVDINNSRYADGGVVGLARGGKAERRRKRDQRTLTPGSDLSYLEVFAKVLRGEVLPTLDSVRDAFRDMRDEAKDVVKAEHALRRARRGGKASTKDVTRTEKKLEEARGKEKKDKEEIHRLEKLLSRQRNEAKADNKRVAKAEKELEQQRNQLAKATEKWKAMQEELLANAKAYSSAITANGAIFGGAGTSVTAAGILAKLKSASRDAAQFNRDIRTLRARGLDEGMITQLLEQGSTPEGVAAVHSLANASKAMIARINKQQRRLERIGASVGAWGVNAGGGPSNQTVHVNMNGPIHTTDVDKLARLLPQHIRKALRLAGQP